MTNVAAVCFYCKETEGGTDKEQGNLGVAFIWLLDCVTNARLRNVSCVSSVLEWCIRKLVHSVCLAGVLTLMS